MSKPSMQIEVWDIEKLIPYDLNSKTHDPAQVEKIANAIQATGWDQPIVVDEHGSIIKGHGRRLAAIRLGQKQVPVLVRRDLSPEQVRAARLADNRVAISGIDSDLLKQELATLDFDLEGIFDKKELDFLEVDLGKLDLDAFVPDINVAVDSQQAESTRQVKEVDERQVKLDKVFGFKTITGSDERHVARFIAMFESETSLTGAEALVQFSKDYYARGGAQ
jgi:hypothetical protein